MNHTHSDDGMSEPKVLGEVVSGNYRHAYQFKDAAEKELRVKGMLSD